MTVKQLREKLARYDDSKEIVFISHWHKNKCIPRAGITLTNTNDPLFVDDSIFGNVLEIYNSMEEMKQ